jgi:hypothetical protein
MQCRNGKRTGAAAIKVAVDLFKEGIVTKDEAIGKVEATHLDQLLHPQFADEAKYKDRVLGKGLPASPGAAVGQIVFTPEEAEQFKAKVHPTPSHSTPPMLCEASFNMKAYHTHLAHGQHLARPYSAFFFRCGIVRRAERASLFARRHRRRTSAACMLPKAF